MRAPPRGGRTAPPAPPTRMADTGRAPCSDRMRRLLGKVLGLTPQKEASDAGFGELEESFCDGLVVELYFVAPAVF